MKKIFNLAANLRALFGVCRLLTIIAGLIWLMIFAAELFGPGKLRSLSLRFEDAVLQVADGSASLKTVASNAGDIQLERLAVTLKLNLFSADPELASAIRWTLFPQFTVLIVFSWYFFSLLRNLCARIERGDVLSEANLRSVRNIGLASIFYNLAMVVLKAWTIHRLGSYLEAQAKLTGINATLHAGAQQLSVSVDDLITGLLILLLAEAFRQGLELKRENELTV